MIHIYYYMMYVYVGMDDNDDNVFYNIWNEIKSCEAEERLSYEPLWYLFNTVRTHVLCIIRNIIIIHIHRHYHYYHRHHFLDRRNLRLHCRC